MKNQHITIIASALPEEIAAVDKYFHTHYHIDTEMQGLLENLGFGYDDVSIPTLIKKKDGFGYIEHADGHQASARAYATMNNDVTHTFLLLQTGAGSAVTTHAISTVCSAFPIQRVIFMGTCLGISSHLKKHDIVITDKALCSGRHHGSYSGRHHASYSGSHHGSYSGRHSDSHHASYFGRQYNIKKRAHIYREKKIVISGDVFINVIQRKKLGYIALDILPENTKNMAQEIMRHDDNKELVLDMESGFVYEALQQCTTPPQCIIIRIVLDTLQDSTPINYREDIKACAEILYHEVAKLL